MDRSSSGSATIPAIAGGLLAGTTFATWSDRLEVGLAKGSAPSEPGQVVLSSRTASELSAKVGDVVSIGGAGELRVVEVVGVADAGAALGRTVLGSSGDIQSVLGRFDQFDSFFVAVDGPADPAVIASGLAEVVTLAEHQASRPDERAVAAKPVRTVLRIVTVVVLAGVLVALYADAAPGGGDPPTRPCPAPSPRGIADQPQSGGGRRRAVDESRRRSARRPSSPWRCCRC